LKNYGESSRVRADPGKPKFREDNAAKGEINIRSVCDKRSICTSQQGLKNRF
jgi:hypothetical protein